MIILIKKPLIYSGIRLSCGFMINIPIIIHAMAGKNNNFRCSHVDSFTGVKSPIIIFLPEKSYAKCNNTPSMEVMINAIIANILTILLFIEAPYYNFKIL